MRECVDFYRYWGTEKITNKKFRKSPLEVKFLYYYRILHGLEVCGKSKKSLTYKYYAKKYKMIKERSHISISYSTQIGEGFYIGHTGRVIINSDSILGNPSFDLFVKLITMFDVSVDQFIHADGGARSSSCRKHIDVLLNSMNEKELVVIEATAEGIKKARETEVPE